MVEIAPAAEPVRFEAEDGYLLYGHVFPPEGSGRSGAGSVVINCATGVRARYYHRYAAFLAAHGFCVLTYDYRGIGLSRPASIRDFPVRWRDWGRLDCDAAIRYLRRVAPQAPVSLVGHSFGGVAPGLAAAGRHLHRILTVGAQFAWWGDYAARQRLALVLKWHLAMPALTLACRYFPGRRLGWLEDLPRGVALDWAFGGRRFGTGRGGHAATRVCFSAIDAPILSIGVSDDPLGTIRALSRTLDLFTGAGRAGVMLDPAGLGFASIGHFDLFYDRHRSGFWLDTLLWLRDGVNPWPDRLFYPRPACPAAPPSGSACRA